MRGKRRSGASVAAISTAPSRFRSVVGNPSAWVWQSRDITHTFDDGWTLERVSAEVDIRQEDDRFGEFILPSDSLCYSLRTSLGEPCARLALSPCDYPIVNLAGRSHGSAKNATVIRGIQIFKEILTDGSTANSNREESVWRHLRQWLNISSDERQMIYSREYDEDSLSDRSVELEDKRDFESWFDGASADNFLANGAVSAINEEGLWGDEAEVARKLGIHLGYEYPEINYSVTNQVGADEFILQILSSQVDDNDPSNYRIGLSPEDTASGLVAIWCSYHRGEETAQIQELLEYVDGKLAEWEFDYLYNCSEYTRQEITEAWEGEGREGPIPEDDEERLREKVESDFIDSAFGECGKISQAIYLLSEAAAERQKASAKT